MNETEQISVSKILADLRASESHNVKLQSALRNIVNWIDGQEGSEQIPPRYLIEAHSLLRD